MTSLLKSEGKLIGVLSDDAVYCLSKHFDIILGSIKDGKLPQRNKTIFFDTQKEMRSRLEEMKVLI